jgi:hypothetical protein
LDLFLIDLFNVLVTLYHIFELKNYWFWQCGISLLIINLRRLFIIAMLLDHFAFLIHHSPIVGFFLIELTFFSSCFYIVRFDLIQVIQNDHVQLSSPNQFVH